MEKCSEICSEVLPINRIMNYSESLPPQPFVTNLQLLLVSAVTLWIFLILIHVRLGGEPGVA
jgi:hypothetical protein